MGTNNLTIKMFDTVEEAPNYNQPEHKGAILDTAVVVGKGMQKGGATVDLIFIDENGQRHVAMITGRLMKSLADTIRAVEQRTEGS